MRKLLFKNTKSLNKKRSELFFAEHVQRGTITQDIEKRTVYRIKEILEFTDSLDLALFLDAKKDDTKPQTFIINSLNTKKLVKTYTYKVIGEQLVVINDKVIILKVTYCYKRTIIDRSSHFSYH